MRSPGHVCDELEILQRRYAFRSIVFHDDQNKTGRPAGAALLGDADRAKAAVRTVTREGGAEVYNSAIPIRDAQDKFVGAVVVGLKGSVIAERVQANVRLSLLTGLFSFVITLALIVTFITSQIARPLVSLVNVAGAAAQGGSSISRAARPRMSKA